MNIVAFRMSCLLAGAGLALFAVGILLQALVPIICESLSARANVPNSFNPADYKPDLGALDLLGLLCFILGLVFAIRIHRREPTAQVPAGHAP
jgi:hypothetical protein